ncbi:CTP-dependent riboflavin kinase [Candidatus Woesearchaeota archaeon]|nr:CTP-dependent riboflavin kinase [Candidatus Woesearchaeota archaeon]
MKSVKGTVVSGLGEGAYFMSMEHYKEEIKKNLGFDAYPGTLNIRIKENREDLLKSAKQIKISGFASGSKTFGGASCCRAKIKSISGAIIVPDINKNPQNILEFIAPVHVKSKLNLKDNDEVEIDFL